jgi:Asp-tRNA(Asn)/Glu-tRNA(Gln) amidotransferase A subunit family amidase
MTADRRRFIAVCGSLGLGSTLFPGVLYGLATATAVEPWAAANTHATQKDPTPNSQNDGGDALSREITPEMIDAAAAIAGVTIPASAKAAMLAGMKDQRKGFGDIRALHIANSVAPAYTFDPLLARGLPAGEAKNIRRDPVSLSTAPATVQVSSNVEKLAFATVRELAELLRARNVTSVALTEMYTSRLKRHDPVLHFAITLTTERAMTQARIADAEIAAGKYRGQLQGIPWGAKDLIAVKGYPTTWGAAGFEHQQFDESATVVERLDSAGAVLIAKLTLGALAMNDGWFGGRTMNPWITQQGSSGSSAGPGAAVAAGCVAFAIGSETLGSISSPSTRCGDTGLRPTFGFVPRTGAMALSWTMDKLGPMARAVEDCALVMQAIYGPDGKDFSARDEAFAWDANFDWRKLRIGYLKSEFDGSAPESESSMVVGLPAGDSESQAKQRAARMLARKRREYDRKYDLAAVKKMQSMGVTLLAVELPKLPWDAISNLLNAESAAAFDDLTRSGRDKLLTGQTPDDWPNLFRIARFYPAVEYVQANRARTLGIQQMAKIFEQVDVIVAPTPGEQLTVTNLTGHPAVIVPNGLRGPDAPPPATTEEDNDTDDAIGGPGTPVSLTFLGRHYDDARLLAFARAYQQATGFEKMHPPKFAV